MSEDDAQGNDITDGGKIMEDRIQGIRGAKTYIQIERQWIPARTITDPESQWEQSQYSAPVWRHSGQDHDQPIVNKETPSGYARGLLRAYVGGQAATLAQLDAALASLGFKRADIERELNS